MEKLRKTLESRESDLLHQIDTLRKDIQSLKNNRQPIGNLLIIQCRYSLETLLKSNVPTHLELH